MPQVIVLVAGVLLLCSLVYSVYSVLTPFVITAALLYLLYPWREMPVARRMMGLGLLLFMVWFLYSILGILAPFLLAFLIAFLLDPLVTILEKYGIRRWISSLVIVLCVVGIVVGAALFLMPVVVQQFEGIISGVAAISKDVVALLNSGVIFEVLARYGIPVEKTQDLISRQLSPGIESVLKNLFEGLFGVVTSVSSLMLHLINIVMIPFLVFYLLMDFPVVTHRFVMMVPKRSRDRFVATGTMVDGLLGRYFRGAIVVALIQGIISATALWLIGVKYALVLGIMTGLLNFIPYVGLLTSLTVSSVVALFSGDPLLFKICAVIILYLSQKLLEATVLGPKIIGSQVGLHPVLLILCLLVFGYFLGFIGLLIAVPSTALIIAGVKEWESFRKQRQEQIGVV